MMKARVSSFRTGYRQRRWTAGVRFQAIMPCSFCLVRRFALYIQEGGRHCAGLHDIVHCLPANLSGNALPNGYYCGSSDWNNHCSVDESLPYKERAPDLNRHLVAFASQYFYPFFFYFLIRLPICLITAELFLERGLN